MNKFQRFQMAATSSACSKIVNQTANILEQNWRSITLRNQQIIEAIRNVAAMALAYSMSLVPELLPDGKRHGSEWLSRNPTRNDRTPGSFSISLKKGKWHDFATGDKGGDLVSLAAYLWGVNQAEAARGLARRLGQHIDVLEGYSTAPKMTENQRRRQAQALLDAEQRTKQEAEAKKRSQQEAADRAQKLYQHALRADPGHPYLGRKHVMPHNLNQQGEELLIPLYAHDEIVNLQIIHSDGSKRFLPGGQVKGCYSLLGQIEADNEVYICEGWATGATIHEANGRAVACAMTAWNLLEVGRRLQVRYPDAQLVIAGDDDRETKGNPGKTAAVSAAATLGCRLVLPPFPANAPQGLSDFNDLAIWRALA